MNNNKNKKNNDNDNDNNNNKKGFEITQERIDVMNTAAEFIKIIDDFAGWVDTNFYYGTYVEQGYRIFEDFVKSNRHIILKINKLMPPPTSFSSSPSSSSK